MTSGAQYKILTGEAVLEIEQRVNEAFANGRMPQGGLSVIYNSSTKKFSFFPAMVKVQMGVDA